MTEGPLDRSNESVLRFIERPILAYLSRHIPLNVTPDALTLAGVGGAVAAAIFYPLTAVSPHFVWIASLGLVINWFGDSLDGTIARDRDMERPKYGLFIDHTADLISQVLIGIGFGLTPYVALSSALLLLCSYLVFVAHTFIRALVFRHVMITYYKVGPTEIRLLLVISGLALAYLPFISRPIVMEHYALSDIIAISWALIGFAGFLGQAVKDWQTLKTEG